MGSGFSRFLQTGQTDTVYLGFNVPSVTMGLCRQDLTIKFHPKKKDHNPQPLIYKTFGLRTLFMKNNHFNDGLDKKKYVYNADLILQKL